MATIIVNGNKQEVTLPLTVEELIRANQVAQPDMVSVQVNEDFLERAEYATHQLKEGDEVEFLYFMGGGSYV
ncbi:MAG: sulfur carrier protein ThiS [Parabacteroides sp.]